MVGKHVIILPEVDSTNNYIAKLHSERKVKSGTVILAEKQTAGRGQRGNSWDTSHINQFTASYFEQTDFLSGEQLVYLNMAVALAVREALFNLAEAETAIKWPNDMLINDKKIAGLLIEMLWESGKPKFAIIGIGINIYSPKVEKATSIEDEIQKETTVFTVLEEVSKQLTSAFLLLRNGNFEEINKNYHAYLWRNGIQQEVFINEKKVKCSIEKVDVNGELILKIENDLKAFKLQEVTFNY